MTAVLLKSLPDSWPLAGLKLQEFKQHFNRRPFTIRHHLADNALFSIAKLLELAKTLPDSSVEYNAGNLPLSQDPNLTPRNGLSVEETIRRIEQNRSWMVLKNVERHPWYAQLLDACLDQLQHFTDRVAPGMRNREGFVFISSPQSVTPFHIDPENNFLLQIRGQKFVRMFDPLDRQLLSEQDIETFFSGAHRNLKYDEAWDDRGWSFELNPGDGLQFPVVAPHWVKNGPEVSVSFSITFQTDESKRRQSLHRLNRQIRRLGLRPSPVGHSPARDAFKYGLVRCLRRLKPTFGS